MRNVSKLDRAKRVELHTTQIAVLVVRNFVGNQDTVRMYRGVPGDVERRRRGHNKWKSRRLTRNYKDITIIYKLRKIATHKFLDCASISNNEKIKNIFCLSKFTITPRNQIFGTSFHTTLISFSHLVSSNFVNTKTKHNVLSCSVDTIRGGSEVGPFPAALNAKMVMLYSVFGSKLGSVACKLVDRTAREKLLDGILFPLHWIYE